MESRARLLNAFRSFDSGKTVLTIEVDSCKELDGLTDRDLLLKLTRWRERRSLSANAYFHVLAGKIAEAASCGLTEAKNHLIADYGQMERMENGGVMTVTILDSIPWPKLEALHLKPTQATRVQDDGRLYRVFLVMRGSHTYDTAEMSRLIDGTVGEAKELGIETLPPDELERMKSAWTASCNDKKSAISAAERGD